MDRHFVRQLPFPPSKLVGKCITVTGDFWPRRDTTSAMRSTSYKLRVLEIDEGIGRSQLSSKEIRVKLLLVPDDDINCTSNVTLVEGQNFWWVRQKTFEGAWFSHLDKTAAAAETAAATAATADTAAAATAAAAAAAAESSEIELKAATLAKLFEKTKGERDGNPGNFYKCSVPGCSKKDNYFVKKGELKQVYSMCKIQQGSNHFFYHYPHLFLFSLLS